MTVAPPVRGGGQQVVCQPVCEGQQPPCEGRQPTCSAFGSTRARPQSPRSLYKAPRGNFNPGKPRSNTKFLLGNSLRARDPLRFAQHVCQHTVAFNLLGRQYTVRSTVPCPVMCLVFLIYAGTPQMQQLKALEEQGKLGEAEEEVTVDKDKPMLLDYESEGEGWGSRARERLSEATKRAEEEVGTGIWRKRRGDWFIDSAFEILCALRISQSEGGFLKCA
ncbi:hypothetical protein L873DRAFT_1795184 [Choiromyces venosus 120613-1]|uniref:Uncharacterized protein n=1 Tax=Choiromyces venosus 120613-1 TaxID=1336337 RepID=A0A3N4IY92_9PEZI|nr:hypothetical protein L873DRAFT_1795184 [Choiromyces venosus 120613-1]